MAAKHPPVEPHGNVEQVWDDVFLVKGSVRMGPGMRIPRNMTIVRDGDELTLISAVRLSDAGEQQLAKLGTVRHVVKIGFYHGMDDAYSVERFGATYWALPGALGDDPPEHRELSEDGELPIADAQLFRFREAVQPECALVLARSGGILLTCDSVQHWTDTDGCSLVGKAITHAMGFMHPANIGPPWRRYMTPPGGSLKGDFERLLELDFQHLLGAHGNPLHNDAKPKLTATVKRVFS